MPSSATLLTLAAAFSSATAAYQGFNYGSTFTDGRAKAQSDFEADFKTAAGLEGTNGGFTSARLYTMIQAGTTNTVISAIPAAIDTKTSLLFGLWGGGGQSAFDNELTALKTTMSQYCDKLDGLVAGISVGSEDLYRNSPIGIAAGENPGENPQVLADYIGQVRTAIKGSCLKDVPIGHVDTWTVYVNGSNQALIDAVDWVGMDAYAYFEDTKDNPIENGKNLFLEALSMTKGASGGKPVWITETGWPVSGKTVGKGVPSLANAKTFWDEVGCPLFGVTNTWWFTLQDSSPQTPNPSFGIIGSELTKKPLYDLSCDNVKKPVTSSKASAKPTTKTSKASPETTSKAAPDTTSTAGSETTSSAESSSAPAPSSSDSGNMSTTMSTAAPATTTESGDETTAAPATTSEAGGNSGAPPSTTAGSGGNETPTTVAGSGSQKLNSMGAAAVALVLAAVVL